MTAQLLVCDSCGARNNRTRTACVHCNTNLAAADEFLPDETKLGDVNPTSVTKWALIASVLLIAVSIFYHFVITVPNLEQARIKAEIERQEKLDKEAKIRAEEIAEKARTDAAWLAEEQARKQRETVQAEARIERDLRAAEQTRIEYEARRATEENARRLSAEQKRMEYEVKRATEEKARQLQHALTNCLRLADQAYSVRWDENCSRLGLPARCALPSPAVSQYDLSHRQTRDECYTRFNTFK